MTVTRIIRIECDECSWDEDAAPPLKRCVARWRADGWIIGRTRSLCPDCAWQLRHGDEED